MKKSIVCLLLCFITVFSMVTTTYGASISYKDVDGKTIKMDDFKDTKGHWAHDTILKCAEYGLVSGYNGNFMPNSPITRGDLSIVIDRMLGLKTTAYNIYTDLSNAAYYRDSVLRCVAAGYIAGTSSNTVSPAGYATREQVATIICRVFEIDTTLNGYTSFKDDAKISAWAKPSVAAVQRLGYMVGDNAKNFNPQKNITRAELITLINNIANTYIPKKDNEDLGDSFKGAFPTNIVTSRNIHLTDSTVGRDLVLTQAANSVDMSNTTVFGRLLVMNKAKITMEDCVISQICLLDGKSTIEGVTEDIQEVYVSKYASESSLDNYPVKLVLESGVRVKLDGKMYENESNRTKTYYGKDLLADLANEQGYVVGGAKITGEKFAQDYDNVISVETIKVSIGESKIKEIGVIWLDQEDDEDIVNPTYQNNDGKKVYGSNKISEPFGFNVGTVCGTRAYRVYAIDEDGLYAYSDTCVFTEYDFNINMKIVDNGYPQQLDVELVLDGNSIPSISNVRVVYDRNETYSEDHRQMSMRLYSDKDAEHQPNPDEYRRYTATITSDKEKSAETKEYVYYPPTAFGYIITFKDGSIINRFPVITEAIPEGVKPVTTLSLGSITTSGAEKIVVKNSKLVTSHVAAQEVGIVCKEVNAEMVKNPSYSSVGWTKIAGGYNIEANSSSVFDTTITISDREKNTFMAPYVKTSNGYYYGDVIKVENNWQADEDGYELSSVEAIVVGDGEVLFKVETASEIIEESALISLGDSLGMKHLSDLEYKEYNGKVYFVIRELDTDTFYDIPFRVYKENGSKSNLIPVSFSTTCPFGFSNKHSDGNYTVFSLAHTKDVKYSWVIRSAKLVSDTAKVNLLEDNCIGISSAVDTTEEKIEVEILYTILYNPSVNIAYRFNMVLNLY